MSREVVGSDMCELPAESAHRGADRIDDVDVISHSRSVHILANRSGSNGGNPISHGIFEP